MLTEAHTDARVADVALAVNAYGEMIAMFFHLSDQNPMIVLMATEWIATLMRRLETWGALTHEQHQELFALLQRETAERHALNDARGDSTQRLLTQLGI